VVKIRCHRPSLANAFSIVGGVVPNRTPKEILKNVMLSVEEGKVTLIGTDQEIGIRYDIPEVEVSESGSSLLPSKRMMDILRELPDEQVEIEITDDAAGEKCAGEIVSGDGFLVATADRIVRLRRIQPAGKKEMAGTDFLRGHQPPAGSRLF